MNKKEVIQWIESEICDLERKIKWMKEAIKILENEQ